MTTENRINSVTNPVNSTGAEANEVNTTGFGEAVIQKAYLRPEYAILLSGGYRANYSGSCFPGL
jgi:hypothetical protein